MVAPVALRWRAIGFGLVIGMPLAAANVYAGLKLGFVDAGATTIVLLAFAVFGAGRRRFSAEEATVAQAAGSSAGAMAVTAGLIGPVPALALSGQQPSLPVMVAWGTALAVLGTLAALPFRAHLIEVKRLAFPSARATGEVIRRLFVDGDHARGGVRLMALAAVAAAAVTVARDGLHAVPDAWLAPVALAGVPAAALSIGVAASPLLLGVGLLVGARTGASMLVGTAVAWVVIAPALVGAGLARASYPSVVSWTLWPGAALMVASSLTSLALGGRSLARGVAEMSAGGATGPATRSLKLAVLGVAAVVVAIAWLGFGVGPAYAAIAVVLAAVFSLAAMHATGETDSTPAGALGGLSQILVGAVGPGGVATPLAAGGIANGVAVHASTMMNAWRAGEVVGGAPRRFVVAQLAGVLGGALAAALAYWVVRDAYGLGGDALPAPGATSWKATADAVAGGTSSMPAGAPLAALVGALAGVALALAGRGPRLARFAPSAVALGMGFILPASISIALALSALAFAAVAARAPAWHARRGPVLASGLIVGEAFTGVVIAAVAVALDL